MCEIFNFPNPSLKGLKIRFLGSKTNKLAKNWLFLVRYWLLLVNIGKLLVFIGFKMVFYRARRRANDFKIRFCGIFGVNQKHSGG